VIYSGRDTCDSFFIVVHGEVELHTLTDTVSDSEERDRATAALLSHPNTTAAPQKVSWLSKLRRRVGGATESTHTALQSPTLPFARVCEEGLFGEEHFPSSHFLRMVAARAIAPADGSSTGCTCAVMNRAAFEAMAAGAPDLVAVVLQMITRALSTKLDTSWLNEGVLRQ
jgi:hypothetical protein